MRALNRNNALTLFVIYEGDFGYGKALLSVTMTPV